MLRSNARVLCSDLWGGFLEAEAALRMYMKSSSRSNSTSKKMMGRSGMYRSGRENRRNRVVKGAEGEL